MKKLFITVAVLALSGCAATPLKEGKRLFFVTPDATHIAKCEALGQLALDVSLGPKVHFLDHAAIAQEAENQLRNAVAERFPQADTVARSVFDFSEGVVVSDLKVEGTAYKCFE